MERRTGLPPSLDRGTLAAIVVSALGYFIDVYDIAIFSIVRVVSLKSLGVPDEELLKAGASLLNAQMIGMLLGGLLWGILGDKVGRIQVLFGSILLYSVANLTNAFVVTVDQYFWCRFIAGIGLAGEIGAGITLVSELLPKESRGLGTTLVATVGLFGGVVSAVVGDLLQWQSAYIIGGVMGLLLLLLRVSVAESAVFSAVKSQKGIRRGDVRLFLSWRRLLRYVSCILVGVPLWYAYGILVTFSPEIAKALDIQGQVKTSHATIYYCTAMTIGDLVSGLLSQYLRARKRTIAYLLVGGLGSIFLTLHSSGLSIGSFYTLCALFGFCMGYWAVYITAAAEQFGTNVRATVTTSIPNFVRGSVVILTFLLTFFQDSGLNLIESVEVLGILVAVGSLGSLFLMRETYGIDLNFVETDNDIIAITPVVNHTVMQNEASFDKAEGWQ